MASAGLLVACGGGGGSDSSSTGSQPNVTITGAAAKGLMAYALVTAHPVVDGKVSDTVLGTATTDAYGQYKLSFNGTAGQPYVIRVKAQAATGSTPATSHYDEATKQSVPLPTDFEMHSILVPATSGTVETSMNVTPFSEIAYKAAANADKGLTAANVEQARSNVAQMLQVDPFTVAVVDPRSASALEKASDKEKALLVMLTAVSQLSNDSASASALGCADGSAGDKTKCVVNALASAASINSMQLNAGGTDLSAKLDAAVKTVVADPELNVAKVPTVLTKLDCAATDSCAPAPVNTLPAIDAAKKFFTNLRSDVRALFAEESADAPSAFMQETNKFEQALRDVQAPVEMVAKDLGAVLMGIDLYNDVKAGRSTVMSRGRAPGAFLGDNYESWNYNAVGCTLVQDATNTPQTATSKDNANFISCRASYYTGWSVNPATGQQATLDWAHGFTLTPSATAGEFTYSSRARYRPVAINMYGQVSNAGPSVTLPNTVLYTGTVTTTTDSAGRITAFTAKGDLPGAFVTGGTTLASKSHSWDLSGSQTGAGTDSATSKFSGTVVAKKGDDSTQSTLNFKTASLTEIPVSRDAEGNAIAPSATAAYPQGGSDVATGTFNVVWSAPGAEFEGQILATDSAWDKSGTMHSPTKVTISGALRNVATAATTEFFSGSLVLNATGLSAYDDRLDTSSTNFVTVGATLQGKVTAPGRPQLELSVATSMKSYETEPAQVNVGYRSLVNGAPTTSVAITASRNSSGAVVLDLKDLTAGLSLTVPKGASSVDLMLDGSTKVGTLQKSGMLTFADGSFISLDLGL